MVIESIYGFNFEGSKTSCKIHVDLYNVLGIASRGGEEYPIDVIVSYDSNSKIVSIENLPESLKTHKYAGQIICALEKYGYNKLVACGVIENENEKKKAKTKNKKPKKIKIFIKDVFVDDEVSVILVSPKKNFLDDSNDKWYRAMEWMNETFQEYTFGELQECAVEVVWKDTNKYLTQEELTSLVNKMLEYDDVKHLE